MSGNQVVKNVVISVVAVAVIAAAFQMSQDAYLPTLAVSFLAVLASTFVASSGNPVQTEPRQSDRGPRTNGAEQSDDVEDGRDSGTVKWFNVAKGFGFITRHDGEEVFVHFRNIRGRGHRSLNEGQRVRFNVQMSEKGLQAEDVSIIRDAS